MFGCLLFQLIKNGTEKVREMFMGMDFSVHVLPKGLHMIITVSMAIDTPQNPQYNAALHIASMFIAI